MAGAAQGSPSSLSTIPQRGQGNCQVSWEQLQPGLCRHPQHLGVSPCPCTLTLVHGEGEKLVPEHLVHEPIWPVERWCWLGDVGLGGDSQPCLSHSPGSPTMGQGTLTYHVSMTPERKVEM